MPRADREEVIDAFFDLADLLPLAGAGRLDPAMAPAAWKLALALSRSPLPRGSVEGT